MPGAEPEPPEVGGPEDDPPPGTAKERCQRIAQRAKRIIEEERGDLAEETTLSADGSGLSFPLHEAAARTDALGELYGDLIDSLTDVFVQVGDARQAFRADPSGVVSEDEDRRSKVVLFRLALRNWIEGDYEGCSLKLALTGIEAIATVQDYLIEEHGRGQFEPVETLGYCVVGALRKLKELDTS